MGQWGQISAGSKTSLFRNNRMHAAVKTFDDQLKGFNTNSGETARQRIGSDQQYRPHSWRIERIANADGMAENDIALKLLDFIRADYLVLERAKTSRYAIRDLTTLDQPIHRQGTPGNL